MSDVVLLIEDNEQNRYLATYLLEASGYEVRSAPDGEQGIRLAEELAPSTVLLDIQLPKIDGYEVARALRRMASMRDTLMVAVTSYAMPGDRESCLAAGCDGYIEKPIDPDTFVAEIEKIRSDTNRPRATP